MKFNFAIGKRIIKTGLAVFITAQICHWLDWPIIFAVIAAIVTIEPSIDMSIKKGLIRLPSAAIGAAFAMLFDALLGQQPLTYMLSAVLTIYLIQLLRWNDALVIATLTSVNMITMTEANFGEGFLVRLGTTSVGIIVSALINYLVTPPNYAKNLNKSLPHLVDRTFELSNRVMAHALNRPAAQKLEHAELSELNDNLTNTIKIISWQLGDYRYRSPHKSELRQILNYKRTIGKLQSICSYLDIIMHSPPLPEEADENLKKEMWEQWLHFEKYDHPLPFPRHLEKIDDEARLMIESLFCHIEFIHILLRQLPKGLSGKNKDIH